MTDAAPAIHDTLDERQFVLAVKRLADCISYGADPSPFLGAGVEYVQSRPYVAGDPVKSIDWRVTARTDRTHVKEYEAPKRLPVYVLVDTSASMALSSRPVSKYAWAVQLATGLALAAQQRLSPAGLLGCGERELHLRPTLSRNDIMQWAQRFRRADLTEATFLGARLRALTPSLENRCMIIVISDLHDPDAVPALKLAAQEHDLVVLQLRDPSETGRIRGGFFRGQEAETGTQFVSHGRTEWSHHQDTLNALRLAGIDTLVLKTDAPFVPHLRHFLAHRDKLGRRRA